MADPNLLASKPICIRLTVDLDQRLRDRIASLPKGSITGFVRALIERELSADPSPKELADRIAIDAQQLLLLLE